MINALPIVGWLISFFVSVSLAVPFWFCWTICNIGKIYFDFLPPQWQHIPFWNCVGLFISVSIIKVVFVPRFIGLGEINTKTQK